MNVVPGKVDADEEEVELSAEELAELDAAIEEADRGEVVPLEVVLRELDEIAEEARRTRR